MQKRYHVARAATGDQIADKEPLPAFKLTAECFADWRANGPDGSRQLAAKYEQVVVDLVDTHEIVPKNRRRSLRDWLDVSIWFYFDVGSSFSGQLTDKQALAIQRKIRTLGTKLCDRLVRLYGLELCAQQRRAGGRSLDRIGAKFGDAHLLTAISTTGGTTTLSAGQEIVGIIDVAGTLVGNAVIIFSGRGGTWVIRNHTTGNFSVTCKVSGQTGVAIERGGAAAVYCNGTDIGRGNPPATATAGVTFAGRVMQAEYWLRHANTIEIDNRQAVPDVVDMMRILSRALLTTQRSRPTKKDNASKMALQLLGRDICWFWFTGSTSLTGRPLQTGKQALPVISTSSAYFKFAKYIYAFICAERSDQMILKRLRAAERMCGELAGDEFTGAQPQYQRG